MSKTPLEIAAEIRGYIKTHGKAVCTLNNRREMDAVLEHLDYEDKKRVSFRFHN